MAEAAFGAIAAGALQEEAAQRATIATRTTTRRSSCLRAACSGRLGWTTWRKIVAEAARRSISACTSGKE